MGRSYGSRHSAKASSGSRSLFASLLMACGLGLPAAGQSLVRGHLIAHARMSAHQMNSTQDILPVSAGVA